MTSDENEHTRRLRRRKLAGEVMVNEHTKRLRQKYFAVKDHLGRGGKTQYIPQDFETDSAGLFIVAPVSFKIGEHNMIPKIMFVSEVSYIEYRADINRQKGLGYLNRTIDILMQTIQEQNEEIKRLRELKE